MKDLSEIINSQADGIVTALRMPEIKTTTVEKELSKKKTEKLFKTRVFVLINDTSAIEYSSFINEVMRNSKTTTIMRESENWTKDGELIRVVDYVEDIVATS